MNNVTIRLYKSEITKTEDGYFNLYYVLHNDNATSGYTHHRAQFVSISGAEQYLNEVIQDTTGITN